MTESTIKVIVIDDEQLARSSLIKTLRDNFHEVEVLAEAENVPEAVKLIHKHKPDLIFIDIDMPGHSGLELPDFFDPENIFFKMVYVTGFSHYAINAFELSAIHYILKPAGVQDLRTALDKLTPFNKKQFDLLKENLRDTNNQKLSINTGKNMLIVDLDDISYIVADASKSKLILTNGNEHDVPRKIGEYSVLENTGKFMRIHRSYIINLEKISKISKNENLEVVLKDAGNSKIPLSQERKQVLLDYIEKYKI